jgi:hypothetical protein
LCRLIFELAVVHDLAHRRFRFRGNFDKIEISIRGDAESVLDADDAYLLPTWTDQSDFRYADTLVDAGLSADGASLVGVLRSAVEVPGTDCAETTPSARRPCV